MPSRLGPFFWTAGLGGTVSAMLLVTRSSFCGALFLLRGQRSQGQRRGGLGVVFHVRSLMFLGSGTGCLPIPQTGLGSRTCVEGSRLIFFVPGSGGCETPPRAWKTPSPSADAPLSPGHPHPGLSPNSVRQAALLSLLYPRPAPSPRRPPSLD